MLLTVIVTMIAVFAVILALSLSLSIRSGLEISEQRLGADVVIYPNETEITDTELLYGGVGQMVYMDASVIGGKLPEEDIEAITPQFFLETLPDAGCCSTDDTFRIIGIDPATDFTLSPWYDLSAMEADTMVVGAANALPAGIKIFLLGDFFRIPEKIEVTGTFMDHSAFITMEKARLLAETRFTQEDAPVFKPGEDISDKVTCYLIKLKDGVDPAAFVEAVEAAEMDAQIVSVSAARSALSDQMASLASIILGFALLIVVVSGLALYSQFYTLISRRQREIGYFRSIGLRRGDMFRMIGTEVVLLSGIGGLLGGVAAVLCMEPAVAFLRQLLTIPTGIWSVQIAVLWVAAGLVFALLICLMAAGYPLLKNVNMEPARAISEGEL